MLTILGAYEFLIKKNKGIHLDVSRLFIYYNGRIKSGSSPYYMTDSGCYIKGAIEGLKEFGCCREDLFLFNTFNVNRRPPDTCYQEASKHGITDHEELLINLTYMKACLAGGYPFIFAINTYQSFHNAASNGGMVQMPNYYYESLNTQHSFHAMLAVGYSDLSRRFIVRNSWSENWVSLCFFVKGILLVIMLVLISFSPFHNIQCSVIEQ